MLKASLSENDMNWAFSRARDLSISLLSSVVVIVPKGRKLSPGRIPPDVNRIQEIIQEIFDSGGVVVTAAGNAGATAGRSQVDMVPADWNSPNFPIIVVGAVDNEGNVAPFSQGGPKVTIHAPGVGVSCPQSDERQYSGTSYAAPMVCCKTRNPSLSKTFY